MTNIDKYFFCIFTFSSFPFNQQSLGVPGDMSYTCETAGHFYLYQVRITDYCVYLFRRCLIWPAILLTEQRLKPINTGADIKVRHNNMEENVFM